MRCWGHTDKEARKYVRGKVRNKERRLAAQPPCTNQERVLITFHHKEGRGWIIRSRRIHRNQPNHFPTWPWLGFAEIHFITMTNTICNLEKYIIRSRRIHRNQPNHFHFLNQANHFPSLDAWPWQGLRITLRRQTLLRKLVHTPFIPILRLYFPYLKGLFTKQIFRFTLR